MVVVTGFTRPSSIVKRNGLEVPFERDKILSALERCFDTVRGGPSTDNSIRAEVITERVVKAASIVYSINDGRISVEQIQDLVERQLQSDDYFDEAKHYILYRAEHAKQRSLNTIPESVIQSYSEDNAYFPTPLQRFQFLDKYARWDYTQGRRQTWVETVDRAVDFLYSLASKRADLGGEFYDSIRRGMLNMEAMPSMRLLAMAGPAAERDNTTIYNCSYLPVDSLESFVEAMIISMAGCGVGFSVESQYVSKLPIIKQRQSSHAYTLIVDDSAEGWANALRLGLHSWWEGHNVIFDYSQIRDAGSVLRTKGGRASGYKPLETLLNKLQILIDANRGLKVSPIVAHDMMCLVGDAVVSGGVRRTAMISLFDSWDGEMYNSKVGDFEKDHAQRWNANNSAVLNTAEMDQQRFYHYYHTMLSSGRGEPGIFARNVALDTMPDRRDHNYIFGTNPCGEILLRPRQFCNLSIAVARSHDTPYTLEQKVILASQIGTIQSLATHFPQLSSSWSTNCEEERLLGVDITGEQDARHLINSGTLMDLRRSAVIANRELARTLGINQSASVTCNKPSGNSSVLLNASSGIHARWAPFYIRNVRVSVTSPLYKLLREAGVPLEPENGSDPNNIYTYVASFPVQSPPDARTRKDYTAVEQCDWWKMNKLCWTEHNPSVTITYQPNEVIDLLKWLWDNRNIIAGMTFLPADNAKYDQMPYVEITEEEYKQRVDEFPTIDWSRLYLLEQEDHTTAAQELACTAGVCEL